MKKLLIAGFVIFILSALIGWWFLSNRQSPIVPLAKGYMLDDVIYDEETDMLVFNDNNFYEDLNRFVVLDLATKDVIAQEDGGPSFYAPGEYIGVGSTKVYLLKDRKFAPLAEFVSLGYEDSKREVIEALNSAETKNLEIYSANSSYRYSFFIVDGDTFSYFSILDEENTYPTYKEFLTPSTWKESPTLWNSSRLGPESLIKQDLIISTGPDGYTMKSFAEQKCVLWDCSTDYIHEIYKEDKQFREITFSHPYFIAFPNNRKEIILIDDDEIGFVELE